MGLFYFLCVFTCVCVCVHLPGICVEVRRQPVVGSLLPCRPWGLNSGHQAWWPVPFPSWAILLALGFNFRVAIRSWVVALKITTGKKASEGRTNGWCKTSLISRLARCPEDATLGVVLLCSVFLRQGLMCPGLRLSLSSLSSWEIPLQFLISLSSLPKFWECATTLGC